MNLSFNRWLRWLCGCANTIAHTAAEMHLYGTGAAHCEFGVNVIPEAKLICDSFFSLTMSDCVYLTNLVSS